MAIILSMIQDKIILETKTNFSYSQYRELVKQMVERNSTTGSEKTEALINYTMLNDRRMNRWDKTIKIPKDISSRVASFKGNITWLVITESWCGDAAHVVPIINRIAELNENIDLKLILRDENNEIMNQFLTNGARAIPKLIMIDNDSQAVINTYGPRPSVLTQMVKEYKDMYGLLTPEFKEDLQIWYNRDKGQTIINDLLSLLGV
ncbi:thioredoxin-like protein [Flavobacteriaceae bacterium MAR_2010_105]|nr:thioredoxin-like protein [Flavobacteriaceae bacterium MAR_2010_105]